MRNRWEIVRGLLRRTGRLEGSELGQSHRRFFPEPADGLTSKKPKLALLDPLLFPLLDALPFPPGARPSPPP